MRVITCDHCGLETNAEVETIIVHASNSGMHVAHYDLCVLCWNLVVDLIGHDDSDDDE
jgi:hypothetical protein